MSRSEFMEHIRSIWELWSTYNPFDDGAECFRDSVKQCLKCGQTMEEITINAYRSIAVEFLEKIKETERN